jgi:hypothetical protein
VLASPPLPAVPLPAMPALGEPAVPPELVPDVPLPPLLAPAELLPAVGNVPLPAVAIEPPLEMIPELPPVCVEPPLPALLAVPALVPFAPESSPLLPEQAKTPNESDSPTVRKIRLCTGTSVALFPRARILICRSVHRARGSASRTHVASHSAAPERD